MFEFLILHRDNEASFKFYKLVWINVMYFIRNVVLMNETRHEVKKKKKNNRVYCWVRVLARRMLMKQLIDMQTLTEWMKKVKWHIGLFDSLFYFFFPSSLPFNSFKHLVCRDFFGPLTYWIFLSEVIYKQGSQYPNTYRSILRVAKYRIITRIQSLLVDITLLWILYHCTITIYQHPWNYTYYRFITPHAYSNIFVYHRYV